MNKSGQSLIAFVLIVPLIIVIGAFIVDCGMIAYKNNELYNITKESIIAIINKNYNNDQVRNYYYKNNIELITLDIKTGEVVNIKCSYKIKSIFGKIIKIDSYELRANISGYKKGDKIIFKNR